MGGIMNSAVWVGTVIMTNVINKFVCAQARERERLTVAWDEGILFNATLRQIRQAAKPWCFVLVHLALSDFSSFLGHGR